MKGVLHCILLWCVTVLTSDTAVLDQVYIRVSYVTAVLTHSHHKDFILASHTSWFLSVILLPSLNELLHCSLFCTHDAYDRRNMMKMWLKLKSSSHLLSWSAKRTTERCASAPITVSYVASTALTAIQKSIDDIIFYPQPFSSHLPSFVIPQHICVPPGSLSARVMSFWGDSPRGMVESAIEFAKICRKNDYHNFLFSMKVSEAHNICLSVCLFVSCMPSCVSFL